MVVTTQQMDRIQLEKKMSKKKDKTIDEEFINDEEASSSIQSQYLAYFISYREISQHSQHRQTEALLKNAYIK